MKAVTPSTDVVSDDRALRERARLIAEPFAQGLGPDGCQRLTDAIAEALRAVAREGDCCVPLPKEPYFVLLGRDPQAPDLVETWADIRAIAEPSSRKPDMARDIAFAMRAWKHVHPQIGMPRAHLGAPEPRPSPAAAGDPVRIAASVLGGRALAETGPRA